MSRPDAISEQVLFRCGDANYALPLDAVAEVAIAPQLYPVPMVLPEAAGIVNVKGEPLPAAHAAWLLHRGTGPAPRHVLVLEHRGTRLGLLVEFVARVERAPRPDPLDPAPPGPAWVKWGRLEGEPIGFLDLDELLGCIAELFAGQIAQPTGGSTCPSAF